MPFYEYECEACRTHHEVLQKISEPPLKKCPECGKSKLKKLVSAPVFRLKGGGWYETDFKSEQEQKRNLAGREEEGKSETKDDKSESKTEAKAEAKPEKAESKPAPKKAAVGKPTTTKAAARPSAKAKAKPAPKKPAAKAKKGRR